jgi:hypothetical protein
MWTRTETWAAYREPFGLERYAARMKTLARLRDYEAEPDVLVVFPRLARLAHVGDRYVAREWSATVIALHRAHYSPLTVSQADFGELAFAGGVVHWRGKSMGTVVLPHAGYLDDSQLDALYAFWEGGGNVVFTKPHDFFGTGAGRPSAPARERFSSWFGFGESAPVVRRFGEGDTVSYGGQSFPAFALPDGLSEHDDAYLDFGDGPAVLTASNRAGGFAALLGFELSALLHGEDMHRVVGTGGIALLDAVLSSAPVPVPRAFSCIGADGAEDVDVVGLVRRRDGELFLSAHRRHDRRSVIRAGATTVVVPPGRAAEHPQITGVNVFVDHVEEAGVVVYNPGGQLLRSVELDEPIASVTTADGRQRWCWFEGSTLRLAVAPTRSMRFQAIQLGERDGALPAELSVGDGDGEIVAATVAVDDPATLVVRVRGAERVTLHVSVASEQGEVISARCRTSGQEGKVKTTPSAGGDRIDVVVEVELIPTLENDVEIKQAGSGA